TPGSATSTRGTRSSMICTTDSNQRTSADRSTGDSLAFFDANSGYNTHNVRAIVHHLDRPRGPRHSPAGRFDDETTTPQLAVTPVHAFPSHFPGPQPQMGHPRGQRITEGPQRHPRAPGPG